MLRYTEEIDESKRIIIVNVCGDVHSEDLASVGSKIRVRAYEINYRILFDFRKAKIHISLPETYEWIPDYYDRIDRHLKFVRTAHLANEEDDIFFRFLEDTFRNRGSDLRMFRDVRSAVEWLESQDSDCII